MAWSVEKFNFFFLEYGEYRVKYYFFISRQFYVLDSGTKLRFFLILRNDYNMCVLYF